MNKKYKRIAIIIIGILLLIIFIIKIENSNLNKTLKQINNNCAPYFKVKESYKKKIYRNKEYEKDKEIITRDIYNLTGNNVYNY